MLTQHFFIVAYEFTTSFITQNDMTSLKARDTSYTPRCKMRFSGTGENGRKPSLICKKTRYFITSALF